jgi:hypothetical protein
MAVGHDFASESHTGTTGSISQASFSWSHNPLGTPKGVLVFVINLVSPGAIAGPVTYDGADVPAAFGGYADDSTGEPGNASAFFLGSGVPTTDPATVVVTRVNNTDELWAVCITVTAATDTATHSAVVVLQNDGTLAEQSITDGSPGTDSLRYAGGFSGLPSPPAVGANSTLLHNFDTGAQTAAVCRELFAGQGARNVGFSSGTVEDRAFIHLAVKEVGSPAVASPKPIVAPSLAASRASRW